MVVENETDLNIKCLIAYNKAKYTSNEFENLCEKHGIRRHFSATMTPQHNGAAERKNRTV